MCFYWSNRCLVDDRRIPLFVVITGKLASSPNNYLITLITTGTRGCYRSNTESVGATSGSPVAGRCLDNAPCGAVSIASALSSDHLQDTVPAAAASDQHLMSVRTTKRLSLHTFIIYNGFSRTIGCRTITTTAMINSANSRASDAIR